MYKRCLVLVATLLAMIVLSVGAFSLMSGMAYAASHSTASLTHPQTLLSSAHLATISTGIDTCSAEIGLGIIGAGIENGIPGAFPGSPIDLGGFGSLEGCTP